MKKNVGEDKSGSRPVSMRAHPELAARIEEVARVSRRKPAAVVKILVEDGLEAMERSLGIKPKK